MHLILKENNSLSLLKNRINRQLKRVSRSKLFKADCKHGIEKVLVSIAMFGLTQPKMPFIEPQREVLLSKVLE